VIYVAFAAALFESLQVGSADGGGGVNPYTGSPGTPVDTGYARNSWWVEQAGLAGAPIPAETRSEDKTGAAAATAARSTIFAATLGPSLYFLNSAAYIIALEFGSSQQAPQGMVRLTATGAQALLDSLVGLALLAQTAAPGGR
jgi:hypothetical protein